MRVSSYVAGVSSLLLVACAAEIGGGVQQQEVAPDASSPGPDARTSDAGVIVAADAPPPPPCVEGDVRTESGGSCFWAVYSAPVDRTTARAACQADGGDLAIITALAESDAVNALAISAMTASSDTVVDYWIGATDAAEEGVFLWPDGGALVFENWRDGEPNNAGVAGEDCSIIEADRGGSWDDRACDNDPDAGVSVNYGYVCER